MGTEDKGVALATAPALEWTAEQRQLIRDTFANGASDQEFAVLLETAKHRRLNPFTRQVFFIARWDRARNRNVWSVQVSIDGLRAVAERTGLYAGQDEPEFEHEDGGSIRLCKVRVYRKDWPRPAVGVAYWSEYAQVKSDGKPTSMWAEKPHIMLAKCAESNALRKAFPEDMGGLYTSDEMPDEGTHVVTVQPAPSKELPGPAKGTAAPIDLAAVVPPTLAEYTAAWTSAVAALTLPGSAVDLWRHHRAALEGFGKDVGHQAWRDLVARVAALNHESAKAAGAWLKDAVRAKDTPAPTTRYDGLAIHQLLATDVPPADADAWALAVVVHLERVRDRKSLDVWETQLAGMPDARRASGCWTRISVALGKQRAALGGST